MPGGRRHVRMRWLQVVLDFVTMFLEYLVTELERVAHPVLDAIVQKVWVLSRAFCCTLHAPITGGRGCPIRSHMPGFEQLCWQGLMRCRNPVTAVAPESGTAFQAARGSPSLLYVFGR